MNNIGDSIGWLERALQIIERYKVGTILKSFIILILLAIFVGFLKNPTYIFDKYKEWDDDRHTELIEQRLANNSKIHNICDRLLFKVDASRVLILELHNGQMGDGGLPFAKATCTYEALNFDVIPVANQYEGVNLSLIPFASKLFEDGYWCGDAEELKKIDKSLYYRLMSNSTEHFAACVIEGVDKPLAIMFVSFPVSNPDHNCDEVRNHINKSALELALLIEMSNETKNR